MILITELLKFSEAAVVAMTILGEAEGEPYASKIMVAEIIVNRARASGHSLKYECLKANQFSCWNTPEKQRALINRALSYANVLPAWRDCKEIAQKVCQARYQPTTTATHYYAPGLRSIPPVWVKNMKLVAVVGGHRFYRETK